MSRGGSATTGAVPRPAAPVRRAAWLRAVVEPSRAQALLVGAVLWEVLARLAGFAFFPPLSAVVVRLVEMLGEGAIVQSLGASLTNLAVGFGVSVVVGIAVGALMGVSRHADAALGIYVNALLAAPSLVFAPVFFSLFGLGREAVIAVIILYGLFIIIATTADAVRAVPLELLEMGHSFNAGRLKLFRRVILPSATPLIMAGLRLGAGRAVKGMVNGEMFIAVTGLGAIITDAGRRFDAESILAVVFVVLFVAFGLVGLIQWLDRRLTSWVPSTARQLGA